jgi:hypothetical protein
MPIDSNTGTAISLIQAQKLVNDFRTKFPTQIKGEFVGSNRVNDILDQENCMGIRIYNGYDEIEKRLSLVLVGVDRNGKDMTAGVIMDRLMPCPATCDASSALY